MNDITLDLGFRYYAVIHHIDHNRPHKIAVRCENYPPSLVERFLSDKLYLDDPVLRAALRAVRLFNWEDIPTLINWNDRHRQIFEMGQRDGIGNGITRPCMLPGEYFGSCTFATTPGREIRPYIAFVADFIGGFAFEAARRIALGGQELWPLSAQLTDRQRECVLFAGRGKSNGEIAIILGLSEGTVKNYIAAACRRFNVYSKTQLAIAAIFHGELSLQDLCDSQ